MDVSKLQLQNISTKMLSLVPPNFSITVWYPFLMESPAKSETMFYPRDEMSLQYSPMSEGSDDSRFCENPINTCSSQPDSAPSSPVFPYRYQRKSCRMLDMDEQGNHAGCWIWMRKEIILQIKCFNDVQRDIA